MAGLVACSSCDSESASEPSAPASTPTGEGEGEPPPADPDPGPFPGEGEGEAPPPPPSAGEGEGEGQGAPPEPTPVDDGTCPRPPALGEPHWCLNVVDRFNTSDRRDLDGDGVPDYFGLREYLINRATLVSQDPTSPVSMAREGFPFQCKYGLLVPHGGGIEGGTEQLARAVLQRLPQTPADAVGAWIVGGRNSTRNLCSSCPPEAPCPAECHHVTSIAIDPDCPDRADDPAPDPGGPDRVRARLPRILDHCPTGLALHGHERPERAGKELIIIGGADLQARLDLGDLLRRELAAGHFAAQLLVVDAADDDSGLGGTHACNLNNRWTPDRDAPGVQLELPASLRPAAVRLDAPGASSPDHPLYQHRHEAQTLLGDAAILAQVLANFICTRLDPDSPGGCGD